MVGREDNEQFCSDVEIDFFYFMQYFCAITIKSLHTVKKDQIIVDFIHYLELTDLLASYFELTARNYPDESVVEFLRRCPPDCFVISAFLWPPSHHKLWRTISESWKNRYINKLNR